MNVNMSGFCVTYRKDSEDERIKPEFRIYGCVGERALDALILHLIGVESENFPRDERGLPLVRNMTINPGFHIWGSD